MNRSPANPRPVAAGRYRYTKWRWRILVAVLDAAREAALDGNGGAWVNNSDADGQQQQQLPRRFRANAPKHVLLHP